MDELVRWLGEQLDADEQAARKAANVCGCHPLAASWAFRDGDEPTDGRILVVDDPHPQRKRKISRRWNATYDGLFMAEHIVRHDPARVLREVEAKRRILTAYENYDQDAPELDVPYSVIQLLALPYEGRPGYREQWRP
ncbi:DUF6221 family protein [Streptomyces sp. NPDC052013]|uniref:DUF6221 family protein n=1 Tax=Streptomyces sp. NPDC052013 TaxID=3365679 RepID=UPI0037D75A84